MATQSSSGSFVCNICLAAFSRSEHLKRHSSTHNPHCLYQCPFCRSAYKRRDALRRHWKSCAVRTQLGIDIPNPIQAGRGRHSCDSCAVQKTQCDRSHPCQACTSRAQPCTYRRVDDHGDLHPNKVQDGLDVDSLNVHVSDMLPGPVDDGRQQHFLDHESQLGILSAQMVTNPEINDTTQTGSLPVTSSRFDFFLNFTQAQGVNDAYNFKKNFSAVSNPLEQESNDEAASSTLKWTYSDFALDPSCLFPGPWDGDVACLTTTPQDLSNDGHRPLRSLHNATQLYDDPLYYKAAEIGGCFKSVLSTLSKSSESNPQMMSISMTTIMEFFSLSNIRRFIDLFWTRWYPHAPIVHKPTFIPEESLSVLVMTMSLLGACTSASPQDSREARSLLDLAEEVVFQHIPFPETVHCEPKSAIETRRRVNILQASYFMCIMQKWEGNDVAKQRIRRQRFPLVVAAVRTLDLSNCTHVEPFLASDPGQLNWSDFIQKEEMTRTVTFVFMIDCSFIIFHNTPPRLVLHEMMIDLTCPETLFQAASTEMFLLELEILRQTSVQMPRLTNAVRALCADAPNARDNVLHLGASKLNMFTIVTALHALIFHQRMSSIILPFPTAPLYRAVNRWSTVWDSIIANSTYIPTQDELWKADGFSMYADEFALLAKAHLDHAVLSGNELDGLVPAFTSVPQENVDGLSTLDETSMSQITDLMLNFEALNMC